jgi:hypothetical protein
MRMIKRISGLAHAPSYVFWIATVASTALGGCARKADSARADLPVHGTARVTTHDDLSYLSLVFSDATTEPRRPRALSIVVAQQAAHTEPGTYASEAGAIVVAYRGVRSGDLVAEKSVRSTVTITEANGHSLKGYYDVVFATGRETTAFEAAVP